MDHVKYLWTQPRRCKATQHPLLRASHVREQRACSQCRRALLFTRSSVLIVFFIFPLFIICATGHYILSIWSYKGSWTPVLIEFCPFMMKHSRCFVVWQSKTSFYNVCVISTCCRFGGQRPTWAGWSAIHTSATVLSSTGTAPFSTRSVPRRDSYLILIIAVLRAARDTRQCNKTWALLDLLSVCVGAAC